MSCFILFYTFSDTFRSKKIIFLVVIVEIVVALDVAVAVIDCCCFLSSLNKKILNNVPYNEQLKYYNFVLKFIDCNLKESIYKLYLHIFTLFILQIKANFLKIIL